MSSAACACSCILKMHSTNGCTQRVTFLPQNKVMILSEVQCVRTCVFNLKVDDAGTGVI